MLRNIPFVGSILNFLASRAYAKKKVRLIKAADTLSEKLHNDHHIVESIKKRLEDATYGGREEKSHLEATLQRIWDEYHLPVPPGIDEIRQHLPDVANKLTGLYLNVRNSLVWMDDPEDYHLIERESKEDDL